MPVVDPPIPPEAGEAGLRAKNLKNMPVIFRPIAMGVAPKKEKPGQEYEFASCDVWTLDRTGVVETAEKVQVSWWRAREQLREMMGEFVACRPTEQDDNSVILAPLSGAARDVAATVVKELELTAPSLQERRQAYRPRPQEDAAPPVPQQSVTSYDYDDASEPF